MTWTPGELTSGPVPLWWQIADRLRRAITQGHFRPGDVVPSEAQLNEIFGVSRTTARAALERLSQEGLISRKPGIGSIVLEPKVEQPLSRLSGFADDMRQRGFTASYRTYGVRPERAPALVATALAVSPDTPVVHISRLLKADGVPMAMSHSWLAPWVLAGRDGPRAADLDDGSLYDWLDTNCGAKIVGGTQTIEAAAADETVASRLDVTPGAATLIARRRSHGLDLRPIEYAVMHYRADRYRFTIDLVRQ